MTRPADSVWRVGFREERAVVMSSRSGRTAMEVFSFEPAEVVAEKSAARARAKEAAQALRDLKRKPRTGPEMTMEVDEDEYTESDDGRILYGGMDMVRERSNMGTLSDGEMWNGTPLVRESSSSGSGGLSSLGFSRR